MVFGAAGAAQQLITRTVTLRTYIHHLQITMFLYFALEHVAELQVQHRHAQQLSGTQLNTQRLFPPVCQWTTTNLPRWRPAEAAWKTALTRSLCHGGLE